MQEFLTQTYYQNTVQEWAIGLGIIVAAVVLSLILCFEKPTWKHRKHFAGSATSTATSN